MNPVLTIESQLAEALTLHRSPSRAELRERMELWLSRVGLSSPRKVLSSYPHELSGGMKQRVLLAMALLPEPALLLADEPTSALDRTLQAELLEVLEEEQERRGLAMLWVSHDLATVAEVADRVVVLYAGRVVECGPTRETLTSPLHPYTEALVASTPELHLARVRAERARGRRVPLPVLRGSSPSPSERPSGCDFEPRCDRAVASCSTLPPSIPTGRGSADCSRADSEPGGGSVRCHHYVTTVGGEGGR